jgi:peptidylprolyl isomerase
MRASRAVVFVAMVLVGCQSPADDGSKPMPRSMVAPTPPQRDTLPAPADVAAPPADALRTPGGVRYKLLAPGRPDGKLPRAADTVQVHYTGWTTDGAMIDSSVTRKKPSTIAVGAAMPGWAEGLQMMTEGSRARLWIPPELAHPGHAGAPPGMLVYDVELLAVRAQ